MIDPTTPLTPDEAKQAKRIGELAIAANMPGADDDARRRFVVALIENTSLVHRLWKETPAERRPGHPLEPIVAAWQKRKGATDTKTKKED